MNLFLFSFSFLLPSIFHPYVPKNSFIIYSNKLPPNLEHNNNKNLTIHWDIIMKSVTTHLKLPLWHKSEIECETDEDCPYPYACCHDPFFPLKDKYCCINYKPRNVKLKRAYILNYIENKNM